LVRVSSLLNSRLHGPENVGPPLYIRAIEQCSNPAKRGLIVREVRANSAETVMRMIDPEVLFQACSVTLGIHSGPRDRLSITAQTYALILRIDRQALNGPAGWRESYLLGGSQWATDVDLQGQPDGPLCSSTLRRGLRARLSHYGGVPAGCVVDFQTAMT